MKIAEGSIDEFRIEVVGNRVLICQGDDRWIRIHVEDLPKLLEVLKPLTSPSPT